MASKVASNGARGRATTPSPPSETIRTPPTPRFGVYEDSWEPYSPRKSARIAQRASHRTPSPPPSSSRSKATTASTAATTGSLAHKSKITKSPFSPKKKSQHPATPRKASSSRLTLDPSSLASASKSKDSSASTCLGMAGMPTPAKTPRKTPTKNKELESISRNLFAPSTPASPDATPARRRKVKKYMGTSLDTFNEQVEEEAIPIFTDVRERPFVVDTGAEDPFLRKTSPVSRTAPETPRRRSKRKCVVVPGEGRMTVEDAMKRDDGIIYTFRGKKFLRKFEAEEDDEGVMRARSGLKPRLLFPPKKSEPAPSLEDEEADTDVEDHIKNEVIVEEDEEEVNTTPIVPATPTKAVLAGAAKTPKSVSFGPMTPPDTKRITRASDKFETAPIKRSSSVFEQWRNTGTKRRAVDVDEEEEVQQPAKRARA